jgi:hypothetical protein
MYISLAGAILLGLGMAIAWVFTIIGIKRSPGISDDFPFLIRWLIIKPFRYLRRRFFSKSKHHPPQTVELQSVRCHCDEQLAEKRQEVLERWEGWSLDTKPWGRSMENLFDRVLGGEDGLAVWVIESLPDLPRMPTTPKRALVRKERWEREGRLWWEV